MNTTPGQDLVRRMQRIYELDLSRLDSMLQLGLESQRVTAMLAMAVAAGERDARRKLSKVRQGKSAAAAKAQAWVVTRALRIATAALRQASAQAVVYRVELQKHFVVPTQAAAGGDRRPVRRGEPGSFDILGGTNNG